MIKHTHTENTEVNFSKLEERIMQINHPDLGKYNDIREMLYELTIESKPTLIMATGGSKVIAYYLQLIIERLNLMGIICEVIEPRDYIYKVNREKFSNMIAISASGNTNGIIEALQDFKGNKYLIIIKNILGDEEYKKFMEHVDKNNILIYFVDEHEKVKVSDNLNTILSYLRIKNSKNNDKKMAKKYYN